MTPHRSIVIGTAGHIDHGKTTLVRALTGVDADRLPEEKRRGITIDLGFASFEMVAPDGELLRVSFVDVPGHSLFIRNMLAGTGCVPAIMLVVAADEGIMPQTVEHMAICELLGISHGVTVITKSDAISASQVQNVKKSIQTFLQGTFLERDNGAVVHVSAATGAGMATLRTELINLALRTHLKTSDYLMRMPIDRSFVIKGFGTVVTGTLLSGTIEEGQTLQLEPGSRRVRVRGLQMHGQSQHLAQPGSRVALNLVGVDATEIHRGQMLVLPKSLLPINTIDAEVRFLAGAPALKHRASVHFHAFTAETMATISLYGYENAQPGTARLVRIKVAEPIVLVPGDRFVLRLPEPAGTIGGGRVLDSHPRARQRKAATLDWLEALRTSSPEREIVLRVGRGLTNGITVGSLSDETGLTANAILRHLRPAIHIGDIVRTSSGLLLSQEFALAASNAIMVRLQSAGRPLKSSELRSQTAFSPAVLDFVLSRLVHEKKIQFQGETVSVYTNVQHTSKDDGERLGVISRAYEAAGLAAPSVMEVAQRLDLKEVEMRHFITTLQRTKTLVRMGSDDLFIHAAALEQLAAQLATLRGSLMDIARFKQLTGLSRKYAIPLLEYLDRQRVTRQQGNARVIL